jgi:hypothetical protein
LDRRRIGWWLTDIAPRTLGGTLSTRGVSIRGYLHPFESFIDAFQHRQNFL